MKRSVYQSILNPILTYDYEVWVANERIRSQVEVMQMEFLNRVV